MMENTHVYIGTLPCGCNVAAMVDMIDNPKETAKTVARMIRDGYAVSRHALTDLRGGVVKIASCIHEPKQSESKKDLFNP